MNTINSRFSRSESIIKSGRSIFNWPLQSFCITVVINKKFFVSDWSSPNSKRGSIWWMVVGIPFSAIIMKIRFFLSDDALVMAVDGASAFEVVVCEVGGGDVVPREVDDQVVVGVFSVEDGWYWESPFSTVSVNWNLTKNDPTIRGLYKIFSVNYNLNYWHYLNQVLWSSLFGQKALWKMVCHILLQLHQLWCFEHLK